jgi:transcriptional regulator with XRE-family HTH domain
MRFIQLSSAFVLERTNDTEELLCRRLANDSESQEAFSDVSSRTYLSSLERGLKSPTLNKLSELCAVMEVHPLTVLTLAYAADDKAIDKLFARLRDELNEVLRSKDALKS